jgi:hypothetical protein
MAKAKKPTTKKATTKAKAVKSEVPSNLYEVSLTKGFPYEQRTRAGVTILRGATETLELSDEQVEAIRDDRFMVIEPARESESAPEGGDAGEGEGVSQPQDPAGTGEGNDAGEGNDDSQGSDGEGSPEDQGSPEGEGSQEGNQDDAQTQGEGSDEAPETVEQLLQNHSRDELNEMALAAGIGGAENMKDKPAVAEAIVAKRG